MSNIVKETAKELGMTYAELAEAIGYGEGALKSSASTGKVSTPMTKSIELYKQTILLKKELSIASSFKQRLNELLTEFK